MYIYDLVNRLFYDSAAQQWRNITPTSWTDWMACRRGGPSRGNHGRAILDGAHGNGGVHGEPSAHLQRWPR